MEFNDLHAAMVDIVPAIGSLIFLHELFDPANQKPTSLFHERHGISWEMSLWCVRYHTMVPTNVMAVTLLHSAVKICWPGAKGIRSRKLDYTSKMLDSCLSARCRRVFEAQDAI